MKFLRIFISLLSIVCASQGFCGQKKEIASDEKVYLYPDQISFLSNGIFIWLNNQQIPVEAIYADSQGIYASGVIPKKAQESAFRLRESVENRRS